MVRLIEFRKKTDRTLANWMRLGETESPGVMLICTAQALTDGEKAAELYLRTPNKGPGRIQETG